MPPTMRGAARRLQQAAQHADGRGLAGAVRAEKAEDLAARDSKGQIVRRRRTSPKRRVRPRRRWRWLAVASRASKARSRRASASADTQRARGRAPVRRRAAATCATSTSVLVATPTGNDRRHATRFGRGRDAGLGGANGGLARVEIEKPLPDVGRRRRCRALSVARRWRGRRRPLQRLPPWFGRCRRCSTTCSATRPTTSARCLRGGRSSGSASRSRSRRRARSSAAGLSTPPLPEPVRLRSAARAVPAAVSRLPRRGARICLALYICHGLSPESRRLGPPGVNCRRKLEYGRPGGETDQTADIQFGRLEQYSSPGSKLHRLARVGPRGQQIARRQPARPRAAPTVATYASMRSGVRRLTDADPLR